MGTKEISTREIRLEWWRLLTPEKRGELGIKYFQSYHNSIEEIEEIWLKEIGNKLEQDIENACWESTLRKSNQKNFKEFSEV